MRVASCLLILSYITLRNIAIALTVVSFLLYVSMTILRSFTTIVLEKRIGLQLAPELIASGFEVVAGHPTPYVISEIQTLHTFDVLRIRDPKDMLATSVDILVTLRLEQGRKVVESFSVFQIPTTVSI